jgi:hypothetical protein
MLPLYRCTIILKLNDQYAPLYQEENKLTFACILTVVIGIAGFDGPLGIFRRLGTRNARYAGADARITG